MDNIRIRKLPLLFSLLATACAGEPESPDQALELVIDEVGPVTTVDDDAGRQITAVATVAERAVTLDLDILEQFDSTGRMLDFALSDDQSVNLIVERVEEVVPGVLTYAGSVEGSDNGTFLLSVEDGALLGTVELDGYVWVIRPQQGTELHTIRQVDPRLLPRPQDIDTVDGAGDVLHEPTVEGNMAPARDLAGVPQANLANGEVRVLFLYANNVPSAASTVNLIVNNFNNSLSISGVSANNRITSAGVLQVASSFAGMSRATIIGQMASRSGPFANLDALMDTYSADVAFLLIQEAMNVPGESVEFGRVGGVAYRLSPANPFALSTDDYAILDLTALHELGHVFGGYHENQGSGVCRPMVRPDQGWMTIMGGYVTCGFNGPNSPCVRLPRWSNPAQSYNGVPLGIQGQSDMESCLETNMPTVSNWGAPPPPASLTKQSESCYGLNTLNWSAVPGATSYQLYRSTSAQFSSPVLVYSGANTSKLISVTSGTWYLRVQACNGAGCGGFSSQVSATRLNYCL